MTKLQRFTWEDALIQAQVDGVIPNGALLVALKLSKAINWSARDKRVPGLYWKNDDALKAVGCGRSSYFRYKDDLFEAGFFIMEKGNLLPMIPESPTLGLSESHLGTQESHLRTEKSLGEHPLSVDTCSEDVSSEEDVVTDSAGAPSVELPDRTDDHPLSLQDDQTSLYPAEDEGRVSKSEEGGAESQGGTEPDYRALAREAGEEWAFDKALKTPLLPEKPGGPYRPRSEKSAYNMVMRQRKPRTNTKG